MWFVLPELGFGDYVRRVTGNPAPAASFRLRTFGTLTLSGPDDATVLGQHGHHRRRLALLAVLAAAADRGWSRDQLLLFFWPEATQSRARHSLDQLLYALRSSIGEELFAATNPVALNRDRIASDVGDFNTAIDRGDLEAAVKQYRGPFLDGFYLEDAPEFERWVEEERARLKSRYASALDHLAEASDASNDHTAAVRWWRALVDADPVSTRNASGLMRALMNAGDHAAALAFAGQYESVVMRELGTTAGPAVAKLVAELRAAAGTERVTLPTLPADPASAWDPRPSVHAPPNARPAIPAPTRRLFPARAALAVVAVLAIAVTLLATKRRAPANAVASLAVLPLVNVSRDTADDALVDGLTQDLITALSKVPNLRVTAGQSSFQFRGSKLTANQIGDSLRVTNLLEGGLQRIGDAYRVQVRLIDVPNGATRWSRRYDPLRSAMFAMQGEIAEEVARALNVVMDAKAAEKLRRGPTQNIPAHDLYLRGRDPVHLRNPAAAAQALQQLEQAVALDSNFAAAYAAIPYLHFALVVLAADPQQARAIQQRAESAGRRAVALDPELPESWAGLAVALAIGSTDLAGSEAALHKAIALGGAPRIREHLSRVLLWSGRYKESLEQARQAAAEDPLSPTAAADVGEGLCVNRRYEEGLATLEPLTSVTPPLARVRPYKAVCYLMQQKWALAIAQLGSGAGGDPWSPLLGYAVAKSGDTTRALRMQREAIERWRDTGRGAIRVVYIAEGLGDRDAAFEWLDRTAGDATTAIMYPFFSGLHADPRFARFRQRLGLK